MNDIKATEGHPRCACGAGTIASCELDGRDGHGVTACAWWWCRSTHGLIPSSEVIRKKNGKLACAHCKRVVHSSDGGNRK